MTRALALLAALLFGHSAAAQSEGLSQQIGREGLSATLAALDAAGADSANDRFALGAVRFLRGVEKALQTRWRYGLDTEDLPIPILRLDLPPNPAPDPFDPGVIAEIFGTLVDDMATARDPLAKIGDADEVAVAIDLADLWFDVDGDGRRAPGEELTAIGEAAFAPFTRFRSQTRVAIPPTIRFDTADAAWLGAYTHLLAAIGELVLAFDTETAIAEVGEAAGRMDEMQALGDDFDVFDMQFGQTADLLMIVYRAIRSAPDPVHTRAVRQHFLGMVRDNRVFWSRVATETDNNGEWIPNAGQASALGLQMPAETGEVWLGVLDDAEALLEGRKLIPHWRLGSGAGINLARLLDDPAPVEILEWIHGIGLLPYAEPGESVSNANWRRFTRIAGGDSTLFMVFLN